jgi:hypothetical protein
MGAPFAESRWLTWPDRGTTNSGRVTPARQLSYHEVALRIDTHATGVTFIALLALTVASCATARHQRPPAPGTITVGVTTSGHGLPASMYTVTIEPGAMRGRVHADTGVFTRSDVPAGDYVVRLLDVPAHCRVDGGVERPITVSQQRRSAVLRFKVVCG